MAAVAPGTEAVGVASPSTLVARPRAATEGVRARSFDNKMTALQVFERRVTTAAAAATPGPDQVAADHRRRVLLGGTVLRQLIGSRVSRDQAAVRTRTPQAGEAGEEVKTPTKDQENLVRTGTLRGEEEGASFGKERVNTTTTSTATTTAVAAAVARTVSGLVGELTATGFRISTVGEEAFPAVEKGEVLVAVGAVGEAGGAGEDGGDSTAGITAAERLRWHLAQPHVGGMRRDKGVCVQLRIKWRVMHQYLELYAFSWCMHVLQAPERQHF